MHQELVDTAVVAAREGAEVLRHYFRGTGLDVRIKGDYDLVSRADHESEERIVEAIRRRFPDHHILAEERGIDSSAGSEYEWLIDPLDGTANFLQGLPIFCISIACRYRQEVLAGAIYDPMNGSLFTAGQGMGAAWDGKPIHVSNRGGLAGSFLATGYPFRARGALDLYLDVFRDVFLEARAIRRCGAAALDLAYTAAGVYDGFFEFRLAPWDIAAGVLLVREAGGVVSDLDGGDAFLASGNVVAGCPELHHDLLGVVRRHADERRLDAVDPLSDHPIRNKFLAELVG